MEGVDVGEPESESSDGLTAFKGCVRRRERMAPGRLSGDGSCFDRVVGRGEKNRHKHYLLIEPIYVTSFKVTYVLEKRWIVANGEPRRRKEPSNEIVRRLFDENEREEALVFVVSVFPLSSRTTSSINTMG